MALDLSALQHAKIIQSIGIIGYGIVGKTFAAVLKPQASQGVAWVGAWDVVFDDMRDLPDCEMERAEAVAKFERQHARNRGIAAAGSTCVTANNTLAVAEEVAKHIKRGTYFLDFNSVSPATKQACAKAIQAAGGHYVGTANMQITAADTHSKILTEALAPLGFPIFKGAL
jgi:3-hydroxyisobutyrate dehydrogenase-like beta-hydroxyacid dehydrogenase